LDAHADLGLGDAGYGHLMSELLFEPVERRQYPQTGSMGLGDGNWISYVIACRWIGDLTYVFNRAEAEPDDILFLVMEGFDPHASEVQLAAVRPADIWHLATLSRHDMTQAVQHYEPGVRSRRCRGARFKPQGRLTSYA
jgi:hypothetical protein